MQNGYNKMNVISSLMWKFLEMGGTKGVQFLIQLILARLLAPEQFGTIAIVMVFISMANVFVQSGFSTALVQKKDADKVDFSSVFYISLLMAGVFFIVIYLTSPYIANFYKKPLLTPLLRVLSITLFFGAFNSIQNAYIAKQMMFKKLFLSSLGAVVISGSVGIFAAYAGLGVWSLVLQQLVNQIAISIIMFFTVKWRPQLVFSIDRIKNLFSFGWRLLVSSLLNTFYIELRTLIIGRIYSPAMLGYYNRGEQFPKVLANNINGSIQTVMLPALSANNDNQFLVKNMMRRAIVTSSFVIFPMMLGMAVIAEPLIEVVLTNKWAAAVPFLQIFCFSYALTPMHTANLQAINAMGRSDIFLKLEVVKKIVGVIILFISLPFGVHAIALGMAVNGVLATFINSYPNKRLLNYNYLEQLKDILPSFLLASIMAIIIYFINFLDFYSWQKLILQITLGSAIYISLANLFKIESFTYLISTIKEIFSARNKEAR